MATKQQPAQPLQGLIHYWETVLEDHSCIISPSSRTMIENTIKRLKRLQQLIGTKEDVE